VPMPEDMVVVELPWAAVAAAAAAELPHDSFTSPMSVPPQTSTCPGDDSVDKGDVATVQCRLAGPEGPFPPSWYVSLS